MSIEIKAVTRDVKGTSASRRLRRAGIVPGVIYGEDKPAVTVEFNGHALFLEFRHEAFHASVLSLELDGKKEDVLLRDYQLHPVRNNILHVDFQRVSATEKIHVKVPVHFINGDIAPGVKVDGGIAAHIMTEAEVICLAKDLPEYVEVDLAHLEIGDSVHLSEIKLPNGVEFVELTHDNDAAVASIAKSRAGASDDDVVAPTETTDAAEDGEAVEDSEADKE